MKVDTHKSVRFEEPVFANEQSKREDWRELLPAVQDKDSYVEELEEESDFSDNENDDREEWIPATSKVTVIQRDAPPLQMDEILIDQDEVIVETYLARVKRNPNRDVGITFTRVDSNSPLCIDHITTHGPFSYTDLESGMVVSAINGKYMTWSSPEEAMAELEKETSIIVTAEYAPEKYYCKEYTMDLEANMEEYCGDYGISFDRKGENLPLYVKEVQENGPFADLLPGLKVIAIDGQFMAWESPETAQQALNSTNGAKCITVEATTENVNTSLQKVAFEMKQGSNKEVVVTAVEIFTKHCPCDLREGMTVVMLNGQVCSEASSVDELMKDAGPTFDIIAVDLNCRRVVVNQDSSAGDTMLTYCGAGALGLAAVSVHAVDMCTDPLKNMLAQQNALTEETPDDGVTGTRQLLLNEEETATRDAVEREDAVNGTDASNNETQAKSTFDSELETAHDARKPYDEPESESTCNIEVEQDKITVFSQDAKAETIETISEQEDASSTEVTVRTGPRAARSVADTSVGKSTNKAETSSQATFKPKKAIAPVAVLSSFPKNFRKKATENKKNDECKESQKPFFDSNERKKSFKLNLDIGSKLANKDKASSQATFKPKQAIAPVAAPNNVPNFSTQANESNNERRTSFEFSLDIGEIEEAPTTMHPYQIQKISNEDVGFKLAMGQNGGVYIAEMMSHCKFRGTGLKPGMRIAKINGVDCPTSMRVTTSYINAVEGPLNLVTTFGARPKEGKKREIFFSNY